MVIIEMDNGSMIKIELDPTAAPITVANFEKLVKEGFKPLPVWQDALERYLSVICEKN